jgi:hypothetical protein
MIGLPSVQNRRLASVGVSEEGSPAGARCRQIKPLLSRFLFLRVGPEDGAMLSSSCRFVFDCESAFARSLEKVFSLLVGLKARYVVM